MTETNSLIRIPKTMNLRIVKSIALIPFCNVTYLIYKGLSFFLINKDAGSIGIYGNLERYISM